MSESVRRGIFHTCQEGDEKTRGDLSTLKLGHLK